MLTCSLGEDAYLKQLELSDAAALFARVDQNREYLRHWLGWLDVTRSVQDVETFIGRMTARFAAGDGVQSGIWVKGEGIVGVIGHHPIDHGDRFVALGYWLAEGFQGRGLMTRSCEAYMKHAFETLKLHRLEIICATENMKSRAIPERLGFHLDGILRQREWLYDHFVDHAVYSMLAEEWRARRAG